MPAFDHDLILKLDPADHGALLAARIAERDATIVANDHNRRHLRAVAKDGAGAKSATDAAAAKVASLATAATHETAFAGTVAAVKVKHAAADLVATDEGHDIGAGTWVMRAGPRLAGLAPIEDHRVVLTDAQCDAFVASYRVGTRASFEAMDLRRQIEAYRQAHPALFAGPGEPPPVDPTYEALRAALDAKQQAVGDAHAAQAAVLADAFKAAGEDPGAWTYWRAEFATGEIVLGHQPQPTDQKEEG